MKLVPSDADNAAIDYSIDGMKCAYFSTGNLRPYHADDTVNFQVCMANARTIAKAIRRWRLSGEN